MKKTFSLLFTLFLAFTTFINAQTQQIIVGTSATANYAKIQDAINSITSPLSSNLDILIEPGEYTERIIIPEISGMSPEHKITISSTTNISEDVVIKYAINSSVSGIPDVGVFNFNGADFITLKNVSIKTTNIALKSVISVYNKSENITIKNCKIEAPYSHNYSGGDINLIKVNAANVANQNNNNLKIDSCTFIGGYIGIKLGGTGFVALPKEEGGIISNCTFNKQGTKAIYIADEANATIENNNIKNDTSKANEFVAIDVFRMTGESYIRNNKILLDISARPIGMKLRYTKANEDTLVKIYNNMFLLKNINSSNSYGISLDWGCKNTELAYNTIVLQNKNNNSYTARIIGIIGAVKDSLVNVRFKNNIFDNRTGDFIYFINRASHISNNRLISKNNVLNFTEKVAIIAGSEETLIDTLISKYNIEQNSIKYTANYLDENDLHNSNTDENIKIGEPISYITSDIDGDLRNTIKTYAGSDEVVIKHNVTINNNPTQGGTANGAGEYNDGALVSVSATPNAGYKFVNWTSGANTISSENPYTFTINSDTTLSANFDTLEYNIIVNVLPAESGTISGAGTYKHGKQIKIVATSNLGYRFVNFSENNNVISTDSTFEFIANADRNIIANFDTLEYNIVVNVLPAESGTISGAGTYKHGQKVSLVAIGNSGYNFLNFSEVNSILTTENNLVFNVESNRIITANFEIKTNIYDLEGVNADIFPNPASDFIYVKSNGKQIDNVYIFNLQMQKIKKIISKNSNMSKIDLSEIENGIYFLIINYSNGYKDVVKFAKK